MSDKPKIGLSLSGGGARGAAHAGVLRCLEEADLRPARMIGVSAGAIVGALYAAGRTPEQILNFMNQGSLYKIFKFHLPTKGLTSLSYLRKKLIAELGEDTRLEDLPLPFHIGLTNLNAGQGEIHDSGPLVDLICASSAIPFLFRPIEIESQQYVDGGVVCNMPISTLREMKDVDFVIGSNLMPSTNLATADLSGIWGIMWRTFDLTIIANSQSSLEDCDFVFEPPELNRYNIFAFSKLDEMFELGYQHAKGKVTDLRKSIKKKQETGDRKQAAWDKTQEI